MTWESECLSVDAITTPPIKYVGPGDVVAGASTWWGLRAYSFSSIGSNAIRLRRDSDQAESDFVTLSNGGLDLVGISSFKGAANLFVTKLYDQTGGGNDLSNVTASQQPSFTLSGIGLLPAMTFSAPSSTKLVGTVQQIYTQPDTISSFYNFSGSAFSAVWGVNQQADGSHGAAANDAWAYAGGAPGVVTVSSVADGAWHAVQLVFSGASSDINVDGNSNLVTIGTGAPGVIDGSVDGVGNNSVLNVQYFTGQIQEVGRWLSAFSGAQSSSMSSNQHGYWGV